MPNLLPSIAMLYGLAVEGDDPVAEAGAANEVFLPHYPSCLEETAALNQVPLGGYASAPYLLICRDPVRRSISSMGCASAPRVHRSTSCSSPGRRRCRSRWWTRSRCCSGAASTAPGIGDWLKTFGYGDFAKNVTDFSLGASAPIVGFMIIRDVWNGFTRLLSDLVAPLALDPVLIVIAILVIYLILGMFLDPIGIMLITMPGSWW